MSHGLEGQDPWKHLGSPGRSQGGPGGREGVRTIASLCTRVCPCVDARAHVHTGSGGKVPRGPLQAQASALGGQRWGEGPTSPFHLHPSSLRHCNCGLLCPHSGEEVCGKGPHRRGPHVGPGHHAYSRCLYLEPCGCRAASRGQLWTWTNVWSPQRCCVWTRQKCTEPTGPLPLSSG